MENTLSEFCTNNAYRTLTFENLVLIKNIAKHRNHKILKKNNKRLNSLFSKIIN